MEKQKTPNAPPLQIRVAKTTARFKRIRIAREPDTGIGTFSLHTWR